MKIVLDTNVLVLLILGGALGALVDLWDENRFRIVVSTDIVSEYATVLARPKFGLSSDVTETILVYIQRKAEFVVPTETITAIPDDPKDNMFLECAVAAKVDCIVSGDPHLNALGQFRGIPILTPRDFIERLSQTK